MKVVIAGASGLVGRALTRYLREKGHEVVPLSRRSGGEGIAWDPGIGRLDAAQLEGVDAIINLAGENIASGRWNTAKKKAILESRVKATKLLAEAVAGLLTPPKVFINASAVGFYGNQEDKIVDEGSPQGTGFLASVCAEWEAMTVLAKREGVRVVLLRIGAVLAKEGGVLSSMLLPFKLGLGGRIGSGGQYMSWVSLDELVHIIDFVLRDPAVEGAVNAVAPCPVTNAEFTKALGKALRRPAFLPIPAFAVRLLFGEVADELLLSSTRAHPTKLQKAGYTYRDPHLEQTLQKLVFS